MTNAQKKKARAAKHNEQYTRGSTGERFARILKETADGLAADGIHPDTPVPATQAMLATKSTSGAAPEIDLAVGKREVGDRVTSLGPTGASMRGSLVVESARTGASKSQVQGERLGVATPKHVNVGTIGHVDHGKTTLISALARVLANQEELSPQTDPKQGNRPYF